MKKVLVSYTTFANPDPGKYLRDIRQAGIKEFAVFLSAMKPEERHDLFFELDKMPGISIPCCHARSDIRPEEIEHMIKYYGTKMFNIHPLRERKLEYDLDEFKDKIYIENTGRWIDEIDLDGFAGLCLDLTHLKHAKMTDPKVYKKVLELISQYKIGFNHISAFGPARKIEGEDRYDYHYMSDMSQLEYLKEFPKEYFADYIAIELGNDLKTQLKVKEYIEKIIAL